MRPGGVLLISLLAISVLSTVAATGQPLGAVDSRSTHQSSDKEAEEDVHQPRHGGYFGDADDLYHYEVLLRGGTGADSLRQ